MTKSFPKHVPNNKERDDVGGGVREYSHGDHGRMCGKNHVFTQLPQPELKESNNHAGDKVRWPVVGPPDAQAVAERRLDVGRLRRRCRGCGRRIEHRRGAEHGELSAFCSPIPRKSSTTPRNSRRGPNYICACVGRCRKTGLASRGGKFFFGRNAMKDFVYFADQRVARVGLLEEG